MTQPQFFAAVLAAALFAPLVAALGAAPAHAHRLSSDIIYTETNDATKNELLALTAGRDRQLHLLWRVATGGRGTGAGLGSQGAVALSDDQQWIVAVNAGSDEVSLFSVDDGGRPILLDVAPSGGTTPISTTIQDGLV